MGSGLLFISQESTDALFWQSDRIQERKSGDESAVGENTLMDKSAINVRKQHMQDRIYSKILSEATERETKQQTMAIKTEEN